MHHAPEFIRLATEFMHAQNDYFALEPINSHRLFEARIRWQKAACQLSAYVLGQLGYDSPYMPGEPVHFC